MKKIDAGPCSAWCWPACCWPAWPSSSSASSPTGGTGPPPPSTATCTTARGSCPWAGCWTGDGDVLSWVDESGQRCYYSNATVRKATLHAVGDPNGAIGTGALVAFADQLSGYNLLTGADNPFGQGNDLYLTLDARLNYIAYQALNGPQGSGRRL